MVISTVEHLPITCFGSILEWGVLSTHREAIAAQHAGVETQRTLQQRLAPPDDCQELPCPRLPSLQLKSQFKFTFHKLQDHSGPVSLHNSPMISQQRAARIKPYEGNIIALSGKFSTRTSKGPWTLGDPRPWYFQNTKCYQRGTVGFAASVGTYTIYRH
jgi:hypothetical protein